MRRFLSATALAITASLVVPVSPAQAATGGTAQEVARSLATAEARQKLFAATASGPADLLTLAPVHRANQEKLAAKGLPASSGSILQIRLANPGATGEPLVAAAPDDDDPVDRIAAYDTRGRRVYLDAHEKPQRPVFVVEVNVAKSVQLGLSVVRAELAARGLLTQSPPAATASGYWATKITAVRLADDEEPWIKGAAEVFTVVGGWGLDGHATANVVQMPYLDHDGTTYHPNQLVVHFNAYKYNLADIVMMEDDGDTNYQQLAIAIANILLTIIDAGVYAPLVTAILNAMPASWWTDDPDYVDSWYTLATSSSGRLNGARANGWMDVAPYWVAPL